MRRRNRAGNPTPRNPSLYQLGRLRRALGLGGTSRLLIGDPLGNPRVQHVEGQSSGVEHFIMKSADIVLRAQFLFRLLAQFENLHLPQLVGQCLTGPRDVAVHFGLNVGLVHGGVLAEEVHHLLAAPVLVMHAGVHYQPDGAPHLVFQPAVFAVRVLIETDVLAQPLGVKRPAFGVRVIASVLAEGRNVGQLLRNGKLQMVPGNAFVIGDGFHVQQQAVLGIVLVHVDAAGT